MGKLTERADKFAKKYAKTPVQPDNRSTDEKMASFSAKWSNYKLKDARAAAKAQREKNGKSGY